MRLMQLRFVVLLVLSIGFVKSCVAQKHDSAYWSSWSKLYKVIDSSFTYRIDTGIVEQTALVQFQLVDGRVDTFYIWSVYDKAVSDWIKPFFKPVIGKYFKGYQKFKYVLVPVRVYDYLAHKEGEKPSDDMQFIFDFIGAFKHAYNHNINIAQGVLLERSSPAIK